MTAVSSYLLGVIDSEACSDTQQLVQVTPKCYALILKSRARNCCNDLTGTHLIIQSSGPLPTGRLVLVQCKKEGRELHYYEGADLGLEHSVHCMSREEVIAEATRQRGRKATLSSIVSALSTALGVPITSKALDDFLARDSFSESLATGVVAAHDAWLNLMRKTLVREL